MIDNQFSIVGIFEFEFVKGFGASGDRAEIVLGFGKEWMGWMVSLTHLSEYRENQDGPAKMLNNLAIQFFTSLFSPKQLLTQAIDLLPFWLQVHSDTD